MKATLQHLKDFAVSNILSVSGKEKTAEVINSEIDKIVDFVLMFTLAQQEEQNQKLLDILGNEGDLK